jgi:hypothetical protein
MSEHDLEARSMAMDIVFDQEARNRILEGVRILARAVKVTGASGTFSPRLLRRSARTWP